MQNGVFIAFSGIGDDADETESEDAKVGGGCNIGWFVFYIFLGGLQLLGRFFSRGSGLFILDRQFAVGRHTQFMFGGVTEPIWHLRRRQKSGSFSTSGPASFHARNRH